MAILWVTQLAIIHPHKTCTCLFSFKSIPWMSTIKGTCQTKPTSYSISPMTSLCLLNSRNISWHSNSNLTTMPWANLCTLMAIATSRVLLITPTKVCMVDLCQLDPLIWILRIHLATIILWICNPRAREILCCNIRKWRKTTILTWIANQKKAWTLF